MKLLVTTAAAALLSVGVAYAEGDAADANGAAPSTITESGAADAAGHAGMDLQAHAFSTLDADASGGVSLEEAQTFDPSVTATAFGGFDADADGALDESEYSSWAAQMDTSASGQGDSSLDADTVAPDASLDSGVDADVGAGIFTPDADLGVDSGIGADTDATVDGVLE